MIADTQYELHTGFSVYGVKGTLLGKAENFAHAKKIHLEYLAEAHPDLLPFYVGVSTNSENTGMPLFNYD